MGTEDKPAPGNDGFLATAARAVGSTLGNLVAKVVTPKVAENTPAIEKAQPRKKTVKATAKKKAAKATVQTAKREPAAQQAVTARKVKRKTVAARKKAK